MKFNFKHRSHRSGEKHEEPFKKNLKPSLIFFCCIAKRWFLSTSFPGSSRGCVFVTWTMTFSSLVIRYSCSNSYQERNNSLLQLVKSAQYCRHPRATRGYNQFPNIWQLAREQIRPELKSKIEQRWKTKLFSRFSRTYFKGCSWIRLNLLLLVSKNRKHLRSSDIKWSFSFGFQSRNSICITRDRFYHHVLIAQPFLTFHLWTERRRNILKRKYQNMSSSKGLRCRGEKFKLEICFDGSFDPRDPYGCWGKKRSWAMFSAIKWTSITV